MVKKGNFSTLASMPRRRILQGGAVLAAGSALGFPAFVSAETNQNIRIGMPTTMSGRVAQLGISSRNAAQLEIDRINAAGGFAGRQLELIVRDSKGRPEESARLTRDLINSDKCDFIMDGEASNGAFAVHEVVRDADILCLHAISETSSLTADPKLNIPNAFRTCRQGAHDGIVAGKYAAKVAKERNYTRWMTIGPDYAYGRDFTQQFVHYLTQFAPETNIVADAWPKLFQPDYTEYITKILQEKPQALFTCLWGGDLVAFIDQGNLYGLFNDIDLFSIALADFTTINQVKTMPSSVHSGTRYLAAFPNTKENAAWSAEYTEKYGDSPTNWSWQCALTVQMLYEAMKQTNSIDGKKIADALLGMQMDSPFGADGTVTMRASDHTLVDYATGWGQITKKLPYIENAWSADWGEITELENEWKKEMGWL